ncbi:PREDICTED: hormone receptor 4-like [Trachymyrmex cornetzi]|uniref:hormone receptor 4-like n=1 Tax=Trachymyrmex cornetzi TaxID=471704 RepID=UPI00084EFC8A|nr:PREDICTED: hormone receptor 4-like [Trachymyrmex cornetzi]
MSTCTDEADNAPCTLSPVQEAPVSPASSSLSNQNQNENEQVLLATMQPVNVLDLHEPPAVHTLHPKYHHHHHHRHHHHHHHHHHHQQQQQHIQGNDSEDKLEGATSAQSNTRHRTGKFVRKLVDAYNGTTVCGHRSGTKWVIGCPGGCSIVRDQEEEKRRKEEEEERGRASTSHLRWWKVEKLEVEEEETEAEEEGGGGGGGGGEEGEDEEGRRMRWKAKAEAR